MMHKWGLQHTNVHTVQIGGSSLTYLFLWVFTLGGDSWSCYVGRLWTLGDLTWEMEDGRRGGRSGRRERSGGGGGGWGRVGCWVLVEEREGRRKGSHSRFNCRNECGFIEAQPFLPVLSLVVLKRPSMVRQDIICCHTLPWQFAVVDSAQPYHHGKHDNEIN